MSIFNKLRFRAKREAKKLAAREQACYDAIQDVLKEHGCELNPKLQMTPYGILPDLVITAVDPQPTNGPITPPAGSSIPSTEEAA